MKSLSDARAPEQTAVLSAIPYDGKSWWNLWGSQHHGGGAQPFDGASIPMVRSQDEAQESWMPKKWSGPGNSASMSRPPVRGAARLGLPGAEGFGKIGRANYGYGMRPFLGLGGARKLCEEKFKEREAACRKLDELLMNEYSSCPLKQRDSVRPFGLRFALRPARGKRGGGCFDRRLFGRA